MKTRPLLLGIAAALAATLAANDLVILHTNDTHSQIEAASDGRGDLLQRKAIIDSVRSAEKNVILVDAGDIVQGTLYFKFFGGDVEYPVFNMMDYDIRVLGNHEFDNGMESLARYYRDVEADALSANYDFTGTELEGVFKPYTIREVEGRKIGFFGINIDPASLISTQNTVGMQFKDVMTTANEVAAELKHKQGCDLVVAVTHIGYTSSNDKPSDVDLARSSKDIDIIIGGHSHTLVTPDDMSLIPNAEGRPVRVTQTGKYGKYIGQLRIDLDNLPGSDGRDYEYSLIEVTNRFPEQQLDTRIRDFIAPYKNKVDSVNNHVIAYASMDLPNGVSQGAVVNWTADFGKWYGDLVLDSIGGLCGKKALDLAVMNVGGIRQSFDKGPVSEGLVLSAFPFSNRFQIIAISGADLVQAMQAAARRGGEAISGNARVVMDADRNLKRMVVDYKEIDPEETYLVGTIDYIAQGNDDMVTMANGEVLFSDDKILSANILRYVTLLNSLGLPIEASPNPRFVQELQP